MTSRALELFVMLPNRFIDAEMRGEVSERQAKLCRFIVRNSFEGKATLSLAQIATGVRWGWGDDTLLRELKNLRRLAWIDFDSSQGQRDPYVIRLTGLKVLRKGDELPSSELGPEAPTSAPLPHDFRKRAPQELPQTEVVEVVEPSNESGNKPPQEPQQENPDPPLTSYLYEGSAVNASGEEKLGQLVGKTTRPEPDLPEPRSRLEPNPFHENGDLTVRVEQVDCSLVWSGEPLGGEAGTLTDLQALADAGLGEWIDAKRCKGPPR